MPEEERPVIYIKNIDELVKDKSKERTTMTLRRDDMARLIAIESLVGGKNKRDVIIFLIQMFEDSLPDDLRPKYEQRLIIEIDKLLDNFELSFEARQQFDELKTKYPKLLEQRKKLLGQKTTGLKKSGDGVPVSGQIEEVGVDDFAELAAHDGSERKNDITPLPGKVTLQLNVNEEPKKKSDNKKSDEPF
jgi:hypothetical protein